MDNTFEDQEKLSNLQKKILNQDINKNLRKLRENYREKQSDIEKAEKDPASLKDE